MSSELTLTALPNEILVHILSFLEARLVLDVVSRTCSRLREVISDDSLWKIRTQKRFNKYPPIDPTVQLKWDNICAQQEEFRSRFSADNRIKTEFRGHYAAVDALLVVPAAAGKHLLVSGSRDRSVALWDPHSMLQQPGSTTTTTTNESSSIGLMQKHPSVHKGWVWSLSANEEDSAKLVSCGWDNMIYSWRLGESGMAVDGSIDCRAALLCSSYVDSTVCVGSFNRKVRTYDLRSSSSGTKPVEMYSHHKMPVLSVLIPKNHPGLLLSASEDGTITSIDRRNRKVASRLEFPTGGYPMCMDLVDGDNCLYVGDKMGGLHLVDCTNGKLKRVKVAEKLHGGKIVGVHASHGGIVTCSTDKTVKLLQPDLGMKAFNTFDNNELGEVTSISHAGGILAIGHSQEVIQVYSSKDWLLV